jgi:hypothetical protein
MEDVSNTEGMLNGRCVVQGGWILGKFSAIEVFSVSKRHRKRDVLYDKGVYKEEMHENGAATLWMQFND